MQRDAFPEDKGSATHSPPALDMLKDDLAIAEVDLSDYVPGSAEEKAFVRKLDIRLFPAIWAMYFMNYLDRTNIGNAKVAGFQTDLGLDDNGYSLALLIFFVGYLLGEIPSNMILTRVRPSIYLPSLVLTWGFMSGLVALVQNKTGIVVIRFFLGIIESGFFPGVLFLISSWYRRHELSKRTALLYCAAILSGAFGGLFAGAIISGLDDSHGIAGWRWLFIIEGCMTVGVAVACYFILPDWPHTTKWLTGAEKKLAAQRIAADNVGVKQFHLSHMQSLKAAFANWRVYLFVMLYVCIVGAGTISYFIPTLTTGLGYTGRSAQYMTIPIYLVAAIFSLSNAFHSDKCKERAFHTGIPALIAGVFFILNAVVKNRKARYVFVVFGASGIYTSLPIILAWVAGTIDHPHEVRGISLALVNGMGNLASIYGAYLWPKTTAPQYVLGNSVTAAFCFATFVLAMFGRFILAKYPYVFKYPASFTEKSKA